MTDFLKDQLERYRSFRIEYRLAVVFLLALLYPALLYFEDVEAKQALLDSKKNEEQSTKVKYDKAVKKNEALPGLENDIAGIKVELNKAFKKLPNQIEMDEVLQELTDRAEKSGVEMLEFVPKGERKPEKGLKYAEKPIVLKLRGTYSDIGSFFDRIVHLEKLVFLDSIKMRPTAQKKEDLKGMSDFNKAKMIRRNFILDVETTLLIYRSVG